MQFAELEIPARPEFVSLARLIVGSIAGDRYELSDDQLDNLKLAVSEACVLAMEHHDDSSTVAVECQGVDDRIEIVVDGKGGDFQAEQVLVLDGEQRRRAFEHLVLDDRRAGDEDHRIGNELGLPLIGSLVDGVAIEPTERGNRLRMTVICERSEEL